MDVFMAMVIEVSDCVYQLYGKQQGVGRGGLDDTFPRPVKPSERLYLLISYAGGYPHGADRFVGCSASGAGYTACGHRHIGPGQGHDSSRHLDDCLAAHGAVRLKGFGLHSKHTHLDLVAVRHDTSGNHIRSPRNQGQAMGDVAPCAALGSRDSEPFGTAAVKEYLGSSHVTARDGMLGPYQSTYLIGHTGCLSLDKVAVCVYAVDTEPYQPRFGKIGKMEMRR